MGRRQEKGTHHKACGSLAVALQPHLPITQSLVLAAIISMLQIRKPMHAYFAQSQGSSRDRAETKSKLSESKFRAPALYLVHFLLKVSVRIAFRLY